MKVFWARLQATQNRTLLGSACLTLILWHITQTIAFFLTIRVLAFFIPVDSSIWSCFDRMSPISYFISSFSFGLYAKSMVEMWPIVFASMFVIQLLVFVVFGRLTVNLTLRFGDSKSTQISFLAFLKATVLMLPVFAAVSLFGYLAETLLSRAVVNSAVSIMAFGSVRDIVVMTIFFYFIPVFYHLGNGDNFVQSFRKTIFSSLRTLPVVFMFVSVIAMLLNAISFLLLDARIVSMGIYEPVKFALQLVGWVASTVVWFFTGIEYHRGTNLKTANNFSSLKGAENEQILETSD